MSTTVFSVESGDRVTLLLPPTGGPPEMKPVALAYIHCPKPYRKTKGEIVEDEPCGYDALEFLRSKCIGKAVKFVDEYAADALQRSAGRLILGDNTDLIEEIARAGLAIVSDRLPLNGDKAIHERYLQAMQTAKATKKGLWAADSATKVRKVRSFPPADAQELAKKLQGKEEKVRVERVQNGAALLVTVLSSWQQLQLNLTGVQSPPANRKDGTGVDPVGAEAKFHTERFLLNRNVTVKFEGLDAFENFCGSVVSSKGAFQEDLVSRGMAKVLQSTISQTEFREAIRAKEAAAQKQRIGIWKEGVSGESSGTTVAATAPAVGPDNGYPGERDFEGVFVQVINGDTVCVRDENAKVHKISLAGVRASKNITRDHDGRATYIDYAWEAKELIRKKFIGKHVHVHIDSGRKFEDSNEIRAVGSVMLADGSMESVGVVLLKAGYGKFMVGRNDICSSADALLDAENAAKLAGVGIHSSKEAPITKVVELGRIGDQKGKYYLSFLRGMNSARPPTLKAVVDIVLGGSSFRVYVPKEHLQISFKLAGIITPQGGLDGASNDRFAPEAKDFSVARIQQREVEIQVETSDKGGNFIGTLFINGKNFALQLAEAGLATVANADRLPYYTSLMAAEKTAKDGKRFIWSDEGAVPAKQQKLNKQMQQLMPEKFTRVQGEKWQGVTVTEVASPTTLYVCFHSPEAEEIMAAIAEGLEEIGGEGVHTPKKNEIVGAYYREDKSWNRAKVLHVYKEAQLAEVLFIDFGTTEELKLKDIRELSGDRAPIKSIPPQAKEVQLAYLRPNPEGGEYTDIGIEVVWAYIERGELVAKKEYTNSKGALFISVATAPDAMETVSCVLLREGVALVDRTTTSVDSTALAKHLVSQEAAHKAHIRMWRFGDAEGEDEEE